VNAARVLVVEDEPVIAMIVEETLHQAGVDTVAVAISEWGALIVAESFHPTHALVDLKLAPGDGRVVARELRRRFNTAVVYATAWMSLVVRDPDVVPGVALSKPYDPAIVPTALEAAREIADGRLPAKLPPGAVLVGAVKQALAGP
jgi:DNA-binding response OmpR family regulator